MENIIRSIKTHYPVSDEALAALKKEMKRMVVPKNTHLVSSGATVPVLFLIEEGVTRSVFHNDGTDTTTWFSTNGDMTFGMNSLYHNSPSTESVETLTECTLYAIDSDRLNMLYEQYADIANWMRVVHQEHHILMSHIFVERLQLSPAERYRCFMQHFPGLLNKVKLKYVAEFLGISIYTLSRIRAKR